MTKTSVRIAALAAMIHVLAHTAPAQTPLGTEFTYQGRLNQAGQPYDGTANLIFRLYDAASGGNLLGTHTLNGVGITDGLFTVDLNGSDEFGASAFNGDRRWLDITVNGTPLAPRQELMAAPHAHFALNADRLDGLDSTAFLQSVPVPLTLSGTSDTHIIRAENAATSTDAAAVYGLCSATTGITYGGRFDNSSASGYGAIGIETATTGTNFGLYGRSASSGGYGVAGVTTSQVGFPVGVLGQSASSNGFGVVGSNSATTGGGIGVRGESLGTNGFGVAGLSSSTTGDATGVFGLSASDRGVGVFGQASSSSGINKGVYGLTNSRDGFGVYGYHADASGGTGQGVYGQSDSSAGTGVRGFASNSDGSNNIGVYGQSNGFNGVGVYAASTSFQGGVGLVAECNSPIGRGVIGFTTSSSGLNYGVYGRSVSTDGRGVYGEAVSTSGTTFGVLGYAPSGSGWGVYAVGHLGASGVKAFRIDHPDDPANKYLLHYSTESPEVLNAYSGTIVLDGAGQAVVELPPYFAKINKDPRYTLTAIGAPMPMLHVAEEIDEAALSAGATAEPDEAAPVCWFRIAGGAPGAKVSWEVKAVRNDRWVQQRGAPVEIEKEGLEKGTYQHPELYGQPPEMGMNYDAERERRSDDRPSLATAPDTTRQK